jgi:hypothetical protein
MAYYPDGDPGGAADGFPGSLFVAGHVYQSMVAEIDIPKPSTSRTISALPVARLLQPMTDVLAPLAHKRGFIMGMAWSPSAQRIFFTHGTDYSDADCDPADAYPGLGSFRPTLSQPETQGLSFLSVKGERLHPFTSLRYIMEIPEPWRSTLGRGLATGRHRGWCPEGTNLYAFDPQGAAAASLSPEVPAVPLMQFGAFTAPERWSRDHTGANAYQGGAWLSKGARGAVAISGTVDFDPARGYYGYADWKLPSECDPDAEARGCLGGRGWRAAQPHPAILLYAPDELVATARGRLRPWQPRWYARVDLSPYMFRKYSPTALTTDGDAENILMTFDRARGLLYVSESFVDGARPAIHVLRLAD